MIEIFREDMPSTSSIFAIASSMPILQYGPNQRLNSQPLVTLREKSMTEFMEQLTDIPEWWKKVRSKFLSELKFSFD